MIFSYSVSALSKYRLLTKDVTIICQADRVRYSYRLEVRLSVRLSVVCSKQQYCINQIYVSDHEIFTDTQPQDSFLPHEIHDKMPCYRRETPRDATVNFDRYRILQRHRAVSLPQHGFLVQAYAYISDRSNADITQSSMIFMVVTQNHDNSRKSRHTTGKNHDDRSIISTHASTP